MQQPPGSQYRSQFELKESAKGEKEKAVQVALKS
jgi:hypothetical protein